MEDGVNVNSATPEKLRKYDDQATSQETINKFANDGSFMAMYMAMMKDKKSSNAEKTDAYEESSHKNTEEDRMKFVIHPKHEPSKAFLKEQGTENAPRLFKRKTARLKTGLVAKNVKETSSDEDKKDAWSQYMTAVQKYKEKSCDDSDKNRPLVK
ncbi:DgyrCDS1061 [Dimorphilus gyrociliatus]|uniref:DgyrCDS1061 n=1 Tax=Dimorphilus gyrociliatus TaxID=2664684 RepID=A0A7I8V999_9ANNE|nr:DgyrCDS1061 [Dimorphilus gyrociliatus]